MKIKNHGNDKVLITFNNGISISTIWGYCTYSDNYDIKSIGELPEGKYGFAKNEKGSTTVEYMIFGDDKVLLKKIDKKVGGVDEPEGYVPVEKWLEVIKYLRKLDK